MVADLVSEGSLGDVILKVMKAVTENYPYHIIAITELAKNYSADNFRTSITECRDVIAQVIADDKRSDQQIARVHILRYLDLQLKRAARFADDEADLMATVLRSLIDLRFWSRFVSESEENATQFLKEAEIDARDIFERLEKMVPAGTYDVQLPEGKRVKMQPSGDEESLLWKICSKLIHPSSWMLNHPDETLQNDQQRKVLSIEVLKYGWAILARFHNINWTE